MRRKMWAGMVVVVAGAMLSGCRVESRDHGDSKDVKVATPFGGVQVKTDDAVQGGVGLPVYPGAQLAKREDGEGGADVNLSFGRFQLRVKALRYRTGDDSRKVVAFYQEGLRRYGDVIECSGNHAVGAPARTSEGLTCSDGDREGGGEAGDSGELQLKAGSRHHQHVVGIEREGAGTKFALIAVDLPDMPETGAKE